MQKTRWFALSIALMAATSCTKHFAATAKLPNPLQNGKATAPPSEELVIELRDMDTRTRVLSNTASFSVESEDKLRFQVKLTQKWEENADLAAWDVWLEDENGQRHRPSSVEPVDTKSRGETLGYARHSPEHAGHTTDPNHARDEVVSSARVYSGGGDYVFGQPRIFTKERKMVRLVMRKNGVELSYRWDFVGGGVERNHYLQKKRTRNIE